MKSMTRSISFVQQTARFVFVAVLILQTVGAPVQPVSASTLGMPRFDPIDCADVTQILQSECEALVTLYNSTNGAGWTNRTNWLETNTPCNWYGVSCDGGSNVTSLSLSNNGLTGNIPAEIGTLTLLTRLSLSYNALTGSIPAELGNLTLLTDLSLWDSQLTGSIPAEIGNLTALQNLGLGANQMTGSIPPEIGNLVSLTSLSLGNNQLTGAIPPGIGNLTALRSLDLGQNQLTGGIPSEIGNLLSLEYLNLGYNQLTGAIPPEIGSLTSLEELALYNNQLTGSIPPEIGNLVALYNLHLTNNQITGNLPPEIGNLTSLQYLFLSANQLTGSIPPEIGDLISLQYLLLTSNPLTGNIPAEIGNLTSLQALDLGYTDLEGEIPASIVNLTNLTSLVVPHWLTSSDPAVLAFLADPAHGLQYAPYLPTITVQPDQGWVHGSNWQAGNPVTLTVDNDADPGNGILYTETQTATNSWSISFDNLEPVVDLVPGLYLTLSNEDTTKTYVIPNLAVDTFDLDADTVAGTGTPGNRIQIGHLCDSVHCALRQTTVDQDGNWMVDFSQPGGPSMYEQALFDLRPGIGSSATETDADGDITTIQWRIPNPNFAARPSENEVHGYEWRLGASVTLTIDDPDNGVGIDYTDVETVLAAGWPPTQTFVQFRLWDDGFVLEPGQLVTLSDGVTTRDHTVTALTVTSVDAALDTVSGKAHPGSFVDVGHVCDSNGCSYRHVLADANGDWIADFAHPGDESNEQQLFDLIPGSRSSVHQSDESGDNTTVDWHVPNPYIEASPRNNWVRVRDWPRGAVVTLTIDRAGSSYTTTATMQPVPWDPNNPNNLMADFNLPEYDIRAGDQLTATVGSESKTLIVSSLEVTGFDVNIDTLSGVATPGAQLSVCANLPGTCIQRSVVADASTGAWSANFSGEVDLQPGSTGWARERDSGGNETWYDWHVPNPYIEASALYNWVHARDWPLGTEVALTIDGANGIYTTTAMMEYPSWDNNNPDRIQADFKLNGYDIQAGDRITATVGTESKTLIVSSLKVTSFDLENDTLAGVADAGTPVEICANVPGNCVHRWATPDASGAWTTDFGNEVDLQSGSDGWSLQTDENGDQTWYDWHVPDPHFLVYSFGSTVHGFEWPLGASVTLTVDDPDNGLGVDYSDEQTVFLPDWNPDQTLVAFTVDGFTLQPGQLVTLSDGVTTKTHTVTTLAITAIDAELDTVSGTAEPGSLIKVDFWGTRRVTADANGEWVADFAHVGEDPDEQDLADIFPGASISVHQPDDDGNSTSIDWRLPDPRFSARLSDNEVHGYDFAVGSFVTLTIDDPDNGAGVDYTDTQTVEVADWNPDETFVPFRLWEDGFVLEPGQLLSVTDGSVTRMLTVSPLRVTAVDADADTVSGTTTPGSQVEVGHLTCDENGCYGYRRVTADEDGVWVADFAHVGEDGGEQDIIDVVIGIGSQANVCDENGNCTEIGWHVFAYTLHAVPSYPEVHGHDWPEDADVTLTIDNDIDPGNGVLYTRTKNVDDDPWCGAPCFDLSNVFDLEVGQYVTMADAHVSRTVQVSVLMVTEVDAEHEILRGIADPGSLVTVNIWSQDGLARHVTTQPDGTWVADFSVSGDEDDEQRTTDIRFGDNGRAIQLNADGTDDGTLEYWTALRPRPDYIKANPSDDWVHSRGWTADAQLTLTVDDPNTPQPVDYTYPGTVSMQQAPWDPGDSDDILAIFDLSGAFDLQVGNTVTVSDGITTHDYVVTPLVQVRWFVGLGTGADPVQIAVQQQVVDDFNIAHPNIELIFEVRPAETALTTLRAQIASGNAPDIIGPMGLYTSDQLRGQWLDLSALVQATGYDTSQFNPALLEMYQTEEGLVGLPFAVYPAVLYYQKSLFDAANLNYPPANYGDPYIWRHNGTQVEWNFETLTQVARQLTNVSNRQYGFIPQWQSPNAIGSFWGPDKLFAGSPSNYTATIPTQWSAAWQWYYDGMWGNEPFIPTSHIANNNWGGNAFDSGQVAMAITEAWYTCCIGGAGSNWDLAALPSYNGSVHGLIHADTFQILKKSAHASEAFEAVTYLLDDAAPVLTTAYNAMPAHTADQDAYFARKSAQFPWVTNWEIMQAGLDYPDIPGNEAWVPNLEQALNRVQAFGDLLSNQDNLNFNQAQNNLQNDLAVIFNAGEPNIEASAQDNWVHARDWPLGTAVTLTIEGAGGPYTTTAAMQQASGNPTDPNDIVAAFDLQGYDIRPGDSLTVNAGTESKTLIVSALTVSGFNLASNTLSGRAAPGAQVEVCAQTSNDCVYRLVTGNNLVGIWNANFGNRFDLKPGSRGWALERDVDGDATYFNWNTALARSDFDGDGDTDLSVFRPTLAKWFVKDQTNGAFGMSGDIPVPADYDGDGDADWAVFRPTMGKWFVKDQSNGYFGMPGDVPVPADYDGDGDADWAVFRPTTGKWFVKDQGNGYFGMPGDIPVPADYDGDGDSDWAVWRPATGKWYIKDQGNGSFGMEGDIPLPADYDGDGDADWAVWRPATGKWYIKDIWSGVYGTSTDIPVPGDYDGDGDVDVAFFRPSTGRWYVKDQAGATFGMNGDFPTPARDTNADGDPYE